MHPFGSDRSSTTGLGSAARSPTRWYATAALQHLAQRKRLLVHDVVPGAERARLLALLQALLSQEGVDPGACPASWLAELSQRFLVTASERPVAKSRLPFTFVTAVNFELTYGCNLACRHCLQEGLRPSGKTPWLPLDLIVQALADADWLGLVDTAVNFTGGEVYQPGSPVLEAISAAARRGIRVRCNTNAWWGGRRRFTVGTTQFERDVELVAHLQSIGLTTLALSLDERYRQYPDLLDRMLGVAAHCEHVGLQYELVATDAPPDLVRATLERLTARLGHGPKLLADPRRGRARLPQLRDATDIGAAAGPPDHQLDPTRLAELASRAPCKRKGFYRPAYLHVNPEGGVRSCLLAPGASPLGSLADERLVQLLNRADQNSVAQLFAHGSIEQFVLEHVAGWRHLYRNVSHPCAASALVARIHECLARKTHELGRDLHRGEEQAVHAAIAREWNLAR